MINERTAELISAALDGALSDGERSELDQLLSNSGEAREYQQAMLKLNNVLEGVPEKPAPFELHGQIMRSVPASTSHANGLFQAPFWPGVFRYSLAAAAGVLFAVGIYESKPEDISQMTGTMAPTAKAIYLDGFEFDVEGLSSTVRLERFGDELALDIEIDADEATEISVAFASDAFRLGMLEQTENEFEFCEFADGVIRAGVQGSHRFAVSLAPRTGSAKGKDAAITLEYSGDGRLVQKTLVPGR